MSLEQIHTDNTVTEDKTKFILGWCALERDVIHNSRSLGFWDRDWHISTRLAEIHSEVTGVLESAKNGNKTSKKIPKSSECEEKLADAVIRIMDLAAGMNWDVASAIVAKIEYNARR